MARKRMRKAKKRTRVRRSLRYNHAALKLRQQFSLQPNNSGDIQGQMNSHSITNFFKNNASDAYESLQEVSSITALYDQFRPVGMKLQYIPRYSDYPGDAASPANMPSLAIAYDIDNGGTITYGNLLTRDRCILRALNKPWTLYFKIPRVNVSATTNPSMVGGWNNLQSETSFSAGGVRFATEEGVVKPDASAFNDKLGAFLVTYYMEVKERS